MGPSTTIAKIAKLSAILEAARLLQKHNFLEELPDSVVSRYMAANPEIDRALKMHALKHSNQRTLT